MSMDELLANTYDDLVIASEELYEACVYNRYFVASIDYYPSNSVPINRNGVRVDAPEKYILIDTTRSIDDFKDRMSFESYTKMMMGRIMNKKYHRC